MGMSDIMVKKTVLEMGKRRMFGLKGRILRGRSYVGFG